MKKPVAGAIAAILALSMIVAPATAAKKKKKKKVKLSRIETPYTGAYDTPAPGAAGVTWQANCGAPNTGCLLFTVGKDNNLDVEVTDTTGQPVYAEIWGGSTDQGFTEVFGTICGTTDKSIKIAPNVEYAVVLTAVPDPTVCPGAATQGSITATAWHMGVKKKAAF